MNLMKKLYKVRILSFKALFALIGSVLRNGMNLMTLLSFSAKMYERKTALVFGHTKYSYSELFEQSLIFCSVFESKFGIEKNNKVGVLCANSDFAVKSLFAVSAIGANIYLLNVDMSDNQLNEIVVNLKLDYIICDLQISISSGVKLLIKSDIEKSLYLFPHNTKILGKSLRKGEIVVLTGGTTGKHKTAKRKASIKDYANPFFALLSELDLYKFNSIFIAPPIYHGFGLSSLIVAFLLGSEVFISEKFDAKKSLELIFMNQIEVVCVVPLMLQRMLDFDVSKMKSLKRIISGGAPLSVPLIRKTLKEFGRVLYNLYGTSEAGFSVLATPEVLEKYPLSVGKPIRGVNLQILDSNKKILSVNKIGEICIKTSWSMNNKKEKWVNTGDLGFLDDFGNLFLTGRADEMIVSGGENVYPVVLENVLLEHEYIKEVAVVAIDDKEFGQRLKAFIVFVNDKKISESEIMDWLKGRVARFEMPAQIRIVEELKYTNIGKIDKKNM